MICLSAKNLKVHKDEIFSSFLKISYPYGLKVLKQEVFEKQIRLCGDIQSLKIFLFGTQFSAFELN